MCCKISFLSYVSHMKGTCSLIWGVTHSCVTAPWLLFVWGPYFWGWQCCVSACWAVVCPKMLQETCPFWRCFLCRQRGRGVTLFASLCGPAVQSTGRDFLAQWPLCPFLWLFACLLRNDLQPMWDTNIPLSHSLYHPNGILSAEDKMWTKKAIIEWISKLQEELRDGDRVPSWSNFLSNWPLNLGKRSIFHPCVTAWAPITLAQDPVKCCSVKIWAQKETFAIGDFLLIDLDITGEGGNQAVDLLSDTSLVFPSWATGWRRGLTIPLSSRVGVSQPGILLPAPCEPPPLAHCFGSN